MLKIYRHVTHTGSAILLFLCAFLSAHAAENAFQKKPLLFCPFTKTEYAQHQKSTAFLASSTEFINEFSKRHHVNKTELTCLFDQIEPNQTSIRLIAPPPRKAPKNWQAYRQRMLDPIRLSAGVQFWNKYEKYLNAAEKKYGIPPFILVGILGIESIYGRDMGHFRTLDTLATLAFEYPETPNKTMRKAFFRKELENLLLLSLETGVHPLHFYGSYAGAIGYPQFMPGSIRKYAVDFDHDGKIDLTHSAADAIGSAAHFLAQHGWNRKAPIVFPVKKQAGCPFNEQITKLGIHARFGLDQLEGACLTWDTSIPDNVLYGVIDLPNGSTPPEYWIGTDNFFAIVYYNRSYLYAMAVIQLGKKVQQKRAISLTK